MLLNYLCPTCGNHIQKIIKDLNETIGVIPCLECGHWLERQLGAPTTNAVETIDDGALIKHVYYDKERVKMARQQGDDLLKELRKKETGESE